MLDPQLAAEYEALTQRAGFARVERSQVAITGRDRATLLHKFCTQDVLGKQPGEGGEAFLCNVQGKIVAYVYFFVGENEIVLDSSPGQAENIIAHLDRYVITEDVQFKDASNECHEFLVAGPHAVEMLTAAGMSPPTTMLTHTKVSFASVELSLRHVPFGGPTSWFVNVPEAMDAAFVLYLQERGVVPVTSEAVEMLRVESGTPLYGVDVIVDNLPQEVARDAHAISFRKGCYLGQETVARIDALGHVNKLLVGVKFPADTTVTAGMELKQGDKVVGRVTSQAWSPRFAAPLALAYVRREHSVPGTQLNEAEVVMLTGPRL
jgi:folate-binding protein YgfZ